MLAPWVCADVCVTLDPGQGRSLNVGEKSVPLIGHNPLNAGRFREAFLDWLTCGLRDTWTRSPNR